MTASPAETEIVRFQADWRIPTGAEADAPALVALSGGADSTALLLLMAATGTPSAATVDHQLRPESAAEAAHCAALCARLGVPHATLTAPLPDRVDDTANLSARARRLRYDLLAIHADAIGARWIVTAHHADDQLETLVMRLNRGSGLRGLAGVRARTGRVVRPLLGWRRAELARIVAHAGIAAVLDPSNVDDRYDRARLRKALAGADWLDPAAAARSATALADAEAAIGWTVEHLLAERCRLYPAQATLDAAALPAELVRRLVERCIAHVDPDAAPRGRDIGHVVARLEAGGGGTIARVRYAAKDSRWTFAPAPPHRSH